MILPGGIGNADANDDAIEERRIAEREARPPEVVTNMERQLIDAAFQTIARDERRIRASLRVGRRRRAAAPGRRDAPRRGRPPRESRVPYRARASTTAPCQRVNVRPSTPYGAGGST